MFDWCCCFVWSHCQVTSLQSCILISTRISMYLCITMGFRRPVKVLKLKKTLCLSQSPSVFTKYLVKKKELWEMLQFKLDCCLLIGEEVICIYCVDNLIFLQSSCMSLRLELTWSKNVMLWNFLMFRWLDSKVNFLK